MAETILDELTRLESTAATIKTLMDKVSNLESQFKDFSDKLAGTLTTVAWADTLPDRLAKIEEMAKPVKEGADGLLDKVKETCEKQQSSLETLASKVEELEGKVGTNG